MEIYAAVKPSGDEPELADDPPELKAKLHRYQRRSAAWMVHRETICQVCSSITWGTSSLSRQLLGTEGGACGLDGKSHFPFGLSHIIQEHTRQGTPAMSQQPEACL